MSFAKAKKADYNSNIRLAVFLAKVLSRGSKSSPCRLWEREISVAPYVGALANFSTSYLLTSRDLSA